MRQKGLRGIRRGKQFVTTRPDASAPRPPDLVELLRGGARLPLR